MNSIQSGYTTSWALVIGINQYENMSGLQGAVKDAQAIADIFQNELGFPASQVYRLIDKEATREAITEHLELIAQRAKKDDRFVFFFAGHGGTRNLPSGGKSGYIASVESQPNHWNTQLRVHNDIISHSQFIEAKHILYIFDCCFSGLALTRHSSPATTDLPRWYMDCMTHQSRQVLTAGLAEQKVADLTDDGHSIFTSHLLKALQGGVAGSEGEITASQVMAYVTDAVKKHAHSKQTPAYGDLPGFGSEPGGDLIFKEPAQYISRVYVPSNKEGGVNTGIRLKPGNQILLTASGVITYDAGHHYTNPDGVFTTYKGQPLAHPDYLQPMIWHNEDAYRVQGKPGRIGSLFGWVGSNYAEETAFFVGEQAKIDIKLEGFLHLAVNDAKGTYGDNEGEFEVIVQIITS